MKRPILITLSMLLFAALACSPGSDGSVNIDLPVDVDSAIDAAEDAIDDAEPSTDGAEEPVEDTTDSTSSGGISGDSYIFGGINVDDFDSFSSQMLIVFDGVDAEGNPVTVHIDMETTIQKDPLISQITAVFEADGIDSEEFGAGMEGGIGEIEMLIIEDTAYMSLSAEQMEGTDIGCIAMPSAGAQTDAFTNGLISDDDLVNPSDVPDLTRVLPNETINGVETKHFHADNVSEGDLTDATIDIWISVDGNYVVRMIMLDDGEFAEYGTGSISFTYNLLSFNQPVDITAPTDCMSFDIPTAP